MYFISKIIIFAFILIFNLSSINSSQAKELDKVLSENFKLIIKSSSKTIEPVIDKLLKTESPKLEEFLQIWKEKKLYFVKKTKKIVIIKQKISEDFETIQFSNDRNLGFYKKKDIKQIKPNSGVRSKISDALIGFQLQNKSVKIRSKSLETLSRKFNPKYLTPLKKAMEKENDPSLKKRMSELLVFGTLKYSKNEKEKIKSLKTLSGNLSIEARGAIASLLKSSVYVGATKPNSSNLARVIIPEQTYKNQDGSGTKPFFYFDKKPEISKQEAIQLLIKFKFLKDYISTSQRDNILKKNIVKGKIVDIPVERLNTEHERNKVYNLLVELNKALPLKSEEEIDKIIAKHFFTLFMMKNLMK